jgi:uncharacterized protein
MNRKELKGYDRIVHVDAGSFSLVFAVPKSYAASGPSMGLRFEWDQRKADLNLKKHGVSFQEATSVFADKLSVTISDPDHSSLEARFLDLGLSHRGRLLVVSYTERGETIRIISARCADRFERKEYENKAK